VTSAMDDSGSRWMAELLTKLAQEKGHLAVDPDPGERPDFFIIVNESEEYLESGQGPDEPYFAVNRGNRPDRFRLRMGPNERMQVVGPDESAVIGRFLEWLDGLGPSGSAGRSRKPEDASLGIAIEIFVGAWQAVGDQVPLSVEDRRIAEALVAMAQELAVTEDPPRSVLQAAFGWLGRKLDTFAEEFFKTAGKAAAVGAGVGAARAVGDGSRLFEALSQIRRLLGV
jgi:hypothetical protein